MVIFAQAAKFMVVCVCVGIWRPVVKIAKKKRSLILFCWICRFTQWPRHALCAPSMPPLCSAPFSNGVAVSHSDLEHCEHWVCPKKLLQGDAWASLQLPVHIATNMENDHGKL